MASLQVLIFSSCVASNGRMVSKGAKKGLVFVGQLFVGDGFQEDVLELLGEIICNFLSSRVSNIHD